tara:strand:- start:363 stop:602 length:240 start_codon:yes stop_codon:yes gene_type:complete
MIDYIKGFAVMAALNFAGLFGLGMIVGMFMALGGETDPNSLEDAAWFNLLVIAAWPFIAFFAFKFSVDKFIKKNKEFLT